ncbi:MAG: sulfate/molybdate ABC transporter ATP-binding protein [Alphaproteobacteria bacterium]|nr:sulfate/molybdate ABC transporter ATP-binding protein [Alphaproteobacteria bacterium]
MQLDIQNVSKRFGTFQALRDVSLSIDSGELVALLGPSGSGKTTLLRIIAGLETPDSGQVLFEGENVSDLSARHRQVGFVFQHYALFRHMTVFENVAFGLRVRKQRPSKGTIEAKVRELLHLVQLESMGDRYPSQLSGGQRQRVALARALAIEPRVLLLDEPFGALDAQVRKELRRWLRRLHDEMGITGVFVTHDQEEALEVADRVVVTHRGGIEQVGSPAEIYDHPATPFIYQFLGNVNRLSVRLHQGAARIGGLAFPAGGFENAQDLPGIAFVRPHDLGISAEGTEGIPVSLRHAVVIGPTVRLELEGPDHLTLEAELSRSAFDALKAHPGQALWARPESVRAFLEEGER